MNDLDHIVYDNYEIGHIHNVTRIRHPTLSIHYRPFMLLHEHDPPICQIHIVQVFNYKFYVIGLSYATINKNNNLFITYFTSN